MSTLWTRFTVGAALVALTAVPVNGQAAKAASCAADAKTANLNFTLKDLEGKDVRLSAYKGKVILLDPMPGLPTTFIINRDGKICSSHTGLTEKQRFERQINALL